MAEQRGQRSEETESDGYTTDETRKRKNEDEIGIFRRSKAILRTPVKVKHSVEDGGVEELKLMMSQLITEVREMRKENQEYRSAFKELLAENQQIKQENENMKKDMKLLVRRLESVEKKQKKNNIVITGTEIHAERNQPLGNKIEEFINTSLNIDIKIVQAYQVRKDIYVAEVSSWENKTTIMKNKAKLRVLLNRKIYIENDYTQEEREIQKIIREQAKKEKLEGKQVKIGYQKLMVDEIAYKWNKDLKKLDQIEDGGSNSKNRKN